MDRLILFALVVASLSAVAQEKQNLPEPEPGNVTLTLDEYNRLTDLANKPVKKPDVPPVAFSLKHAEIKLVAKSDSVSGTAQFRGEVLKKGAVRVPLTRGLTIFNASQDGKPLPLEPANGTQTAILSATGDFSLGLDIGQAVRVEAGQASFKLQIPAAGSVTLSLTVPGEYTTVNVTPGLITSRTAGAGTTTVLATLVPGQATNISWATRETSAVPAVAREVRFLADVKTLLSISEASLNASVLADLSVIQGEPQQFEIDVPSGYEVTGVSGAALDSSDQKGQALTLKLAGASQKSYEFLISLERSLSATKADAPIIEFKGAQRETGEVLVEGTGSTEITATESGSMKRMDVKETNADLRGLAHYPAQAAFRYHRQPNEIPALALDWVRFPDSTVLAAVAEDAEVTTLVTSEGKSLTEVKLTIRNQAQPFLKIDLPQGSILSADVSGEKVKPVEATDGSRVPLLRAGFRPTGAYTVSFVFMHAGTPFAKKGDSQLSLPGMDIPINLLQWEVFLPEQYKVKDFNGDVISADRVAPAFTENDSEGNYAPALPQSAATTSNFNYRVEPLLPGQVGGLVLDQSGAVIPNAKVSVTSAETGFKMDATTDSNGFWRVWSMPSGRVKVHIDSPGFKGLQQDYIYDSERPQAFNSILSVGSVSESVEVSALATGANIAEMERENKKQAQIAQSTPSANVVNLQRRVAGVLPVAIDVPHAGTAFHFVRPLVVDEETKVSFTYKGK